ncbi:hypothetical protein [Providencia alcalifaciens]|uniref:hypothetical protein n=1 Tax=Providencia alcalifaciens TaxID=126385 RepID=UPI00029BA2C6|nr:hypothetical protein [Providencia alcalifaciens]EKT66281.1 hypothetical protein OO9_06972 [Providencia alcalifaciens Dmel2]
MKLLISSKIRQKLAGKIPPVNEDDILQCFSNRSGHFLEDTREDNKTDPATKWFISETDYGVVLKIVCIFYPDKGVAIRTAYKPNDEELRIYQKYAQEK